MKFNRKNTLAQAPNLMKVQSRPMEKVKHNTMPVTDFAEYVKTFPRELNQYEKIMLKKIWSTYQLTRKLNFDNCFKNKSYHKLVPHNLNNRYEFYPYYSNFVYRERGANFVPIAAAISRQLRIEVNSFFYRTHSSIWHAIVWHEMAHLIDKFHVSVVCSQKKIIKDSLRRKKMTIPANKAQRSALAYFTQPDKDCFDQRIDWFNLTQEAFAECFSTIMLLVTQGLNARTLQRLDKRVAFICVYHDTLCDLFNQIDFAKMGFRLTPMKKQKILQFFHDIHHRDNYRYIYRKKHQKITKALHTI
jgi:hypothetical protein